MEIRFCFVEKKNVCNIILPHQKIYEKRTICSSALYELLRREGSVRLFGLLTFNIQGLLHCHSVIIGKEIGIVQKYQDSILAILIARSTGPRWWNLSRNRTPWLKLIIMYSFSEILNGLKQFVNFQFFSLKFLDLLNFSFKRKIIVFSFQGAIQELMTVQMDTLSSLMMAQLVSALIPVHLLIALSKHLNRGQWTIVKILVISPIRNSQTKAHFFR